MMVEQHENLPMMQPADTLVMNQPHYTFTLQLVATTHFPSHLTEGRELSWPEYTVAICLTLAANGQVIFSSLISCNYKSLALESDQCTSAPTVYMSSMDGHSFSST